MFTCIPVAPDVIVITSSSGRYDMNLQYRKDIADKDIFATEEGDCFDQTTTNCCAFALRAAVALGAVWKL
jgi:hypothetical protein